MTPQDKAILKDRRERMHRLHLMRAARVARRKRQVERAARYVETNRKLDLPVVDTRDLEAEFAPGMGSSCDLLNDYIATGIAGDGIRRTPPKPPCP